MRHDMDIKCKPGTKVYFLGKNGYEAQLNIALKTFKIGEELTVERIRVDNFMSYVTFKEYPGKEYNTVMFSETPPDNPKAYKISTKVKIHAIVGTIFALFIGLTLYHPPYGFFVFIFSAAAFAITMLYLIIVEAISDYIDMKKSN